jgi:hypothetical protein
MVPNYKPEEEEDGLSTLLTADASFFYFFDRAQPKVLTL